MTSFFTDIYKGYRVISRFVLGKTYYVPQIYMFPFWYNIVGQEHKDKNGNTFVVFIPAEQESLWFETEHEAYEAVKKIKRYG